MREARSDQALERRVEEMVSGLDATLAVGETIRADIDRAVPAERGAAQALTGPRDRGSRCRA